MEKTVSIKIVGFLVGDIWMPKTECWKEFKYDITREQARFAPGEKLTLREHAIRATNDGDFQSCEMGDAFLVIETARILKSGTVVTRSRSWPMEMFPSVSDMVRPDFAPVYAGEGG